MKKIKTNSEKIAHTHARTPPVSSKEPKEWKAMQPIKQLTQEIRRIM